MPRETGVSDALLRPSTPPVPRRAWRGGTRANHASACGRPPVTGAGEEAVVRRRTRRFGRAHNRSGGGVQDGWYWSSCGVLVKGGDGNFEVRCFESAQLRRGAGNRGGVPAGRRILFLLQTAALFRDAATVRINAAEHPRLNRHRRDCGPPGAEDSRHRVDFRRLPQMHFHS